MSVKVKTIDGALPFGGSDVGLCGPSTDDLLRIRRSRLIARDPATLAEELDNIAAIEGLTRMIAALRSGR